LSNNLKSFRNQTITRVRGDEVAIASLSLVVESVRTTRALVESPNARAPWQIDDEVAKSVDVDCRK
jgi:hypothetical protein